MEYLRGWRALRNDPQWMGKVGVASLIILSAMCIPVVGQIVIIGWNALMLRRAVSGQDTPLPRMEFDFDYLSKLLNVGFKGFLAQLLWSLPLYVFGFGSVCCIYAGMGGAFSLVAAGGAAGGEAGAAGGMLGALCMMVAFFVIYFAVLIAVVMPMQIAILRAEITDDVNAAMRLKEVFDTTKMLWKELAKGFFVMWLLGIAASFVAIFTLYIGLFPCIVILSVIQAYWRAELYQAYLQKGGQPLPIGPLDVEGGDMANVQPGQPQQPGQQPPGQWGGPPPQF
jgi:hypothetical protein